MTAAEFIFIFAILFHVIGCFIAGNPELVI